MIVSTTSAGGVTANAEAGQAFNGVIGIFSALGDIVAGTDESITWGDGQTSMGMVTAIGNDIYQMSGTHTYSSAGVFPVQGSADFTDSDSYATVDSLLTVVAAAGSAPPKVAGMAGPTSAGTAGRVAPEISASFTGVVNSSAIQYAAKVQFSDGFFATPTAVFDQQGALDVSATGPLLGRPGNYSAQVRLYRDGQLIGSVRVPASVALDSPGGVTIDASAGHSFSGSLGTFDQGLASLGQYHPTGVVVDWGDGTTTTGTLELVGQGADASGAEQGIYSVAGAHAYARPGRFMITVNDQFAGQSFPAEVGPGATTLLNPGFPAPVDLDDDPSGPVIYDTAVVGKAI